MIKRLYIHNFRCLENFELDLSDLRSTLLIGRNGAGKSTIGWCLEFLQTIARGTNRIGNLVEPKDFTRGRKDSPMRFELDVILGQSSFRYTLALELPPKFKELRVLEERLIENGVDIYRRNVAEVLLSRRESFSPSEFVVDWHLVALPIIQEESRSDPLSVFRTWLSRALIISPNPSMITGESRDETLNLQRDCSNIASVYSGLLAEHPAAYSSIEKYVRSVMPEFRDFTNQPTGKDSRNMRVRFSTQEMVEYLESPPSKPIEFKPDFQDLSDGEKCFFVCAVVLAANEHIGPLLCFWDEPDNHLAMGEIGHFITALRRSFDGGAQLIATSHNAETIRSFTDDSTLLVHRRTRFEPTSTTRLSDAHYEGDLINNILKGDLDP